MLAVPAPACPRRRAWRSHTFSVATYCSFPPSPKPRYLRLASIRLPTCFGEMCLQKMTLSAAKAGGLLSPPAAHFPRGQLHSPSWAFPSILAPMVAHTSTATGLVANSWGWHQRQCNTVKSYFGKHQKNLFAVSCSGHSPRLPTFLPVYRKRKTCSPGQHCLLTQLAKFV